VRIIGSLDQKKTIKERRAPNITANTCDLSAFDWDPFLKLLYKFIKTIKAKKTKFKEYD